MPILLLTAQLLVSLTLLISGAAKLGDRRGTQDAMVSLRLPLPRAHATAALLLPGAEIALALGICLPVPLVPLAFSVLIVVLLVLYWAIIARALRFEESVSCSCFGTLGSPTVSRTTLVRNTLLLALGALTVIGTARSLPAHAAADASGLLVQLVLAVLLTGVLTLLTLRGTSRRSETGPGTATVGDRPSAHERSDAEDPRTGSADDADLDYERTPTPFGMLQRSGEEPVSLASLTAERAALLIWVRPGCGPCERVLNAVGPWRAALEETVSVRTLVRADPAGLAPSVRERAGDSLARDIEGNLAISLRAGSSPAAVLLGADGLLAGGPVAGAEGVTAFVEEIIEQIGQARERGELVSPSA